MSIGLSEPVRFVLVGASGYVVNVAAFGAVLGAGTGHFAAATVATFLAATSNYIANRYFTFTTTRVAFWSGYLRYLLVAAIAVALTLALLAALADGARLDPRPAQALAVALVAPIAFVLFRRVAFLLDVRGLRAVSTPTATPTDRPDQAAIGVHSRSVRRAPRAVAIPGRRHPE